MEKCMNAWSPASKILNYISISTEIYQSMQNKNTLYTVRLKTLCLQFSRVVEWNNHNAGMK